MPCQSLPSHVLMKLCHCQWFQGLLWGSIHLDCFPAQDTTKKDGAALASVPAAATGAGDSDKAGRNVHDVVALGCMFLFV